MSEQLGFISFVPWTLIFTIINAYILYRIVKRFLFKPVQKILKKRQEEVDQMYQDAETLQKTADQKQAQYDMQLMQAQQEAKKIILDSKQEAQREQKLSQQDAKQTATLIIEQAKQDALHLKESALIDCQDAIANMSIDIASKMTQQEMDEETHNRLIENALAQLEEVNL